MYDICSAILKINPSAQVSVNAEDLEQITWHAGTPVIPQADIEAMMVELKADYDSMEYSRKRKSEYPLLDDVTIALAEKAEGRSEMWDEITVKRATVRAKYPKE